MAMAVATGSVAIADPRSGNRRIAAVLAEIRDRHQGVIEMARRAAMVNDKEMKAEMARKAEVAHVEVRRLVEELKGLLRYSTKFIVRRYPRNGSAVEVDRDLGLAPTVSSGCVDVRSVNASSWGCVGYRPHVGDPVEVSFCHIEAIVICR